MQEMRKPWDYLIVTASHEIQARAYESQLAVRQRLGLLANFGQVRVFPDPDGRRIGSGGFLMMIAKSPQDARRVRRDLEARPINERSRFFEYQINRRGLEVTTC